MLFNFDFANNTIISCFFFFFLIIGLYFSIAAVITQNKVNFYLLTKNR